MINQLELAPETDALDPGLGNQPGGHVLRHGEPGNCGNPMSLGNCGTDSVRIVARPHGVPAHLVRRHHVLERLARAAALFPDDEILLLQFMRLDR